MIQVEDNFYTFFAGAEITIGLFFMTIALQKKTNITLLLLGILSLCSSIYLAFFFESGEGGVWNTRTMIAAPFMIPNAFCLLAVFENGSDSPDEGLLVPRCGTIAKGQEY
jgi:hypothetical protein